MENKRHKWSVFVGDYATNDYEYVENERVIKVNAIISGYLTTGEIKIPKKMSIILTNMLKIFDESGSFSLGDLTRRIYGYEDNSSRNSVTQSIYRAKEKIGQFFYKQHKKAKMSFE